MTSKRKKLSKIRKKKQFYMNAQAMLDILRCATDAERERAQRLAQGLPEEEDSEGSEDGDDEGATDSDSE